MRTIALLLLALALCFTASTISGHDAVGNPTLMIADGAVMGGPKPPPPTGTFSVLAENSTVGSPKPPPPTGRS